MSWLDEFKQASFRDIEFFVDGHELGSGRRNQITEFPGRDDPYVEDLGRKARTRTMEAYVIGDDYHIQKNKLIKALDQAGPGKLVHPYDGILQVAITDYKVRETKREQSIARFSISFVQVEEIELITKVTNTVEEVSEKKQSAFEALKEKFKKAWKTANKPRTVVDGAFDTVNKGIDMAESARSVVSDIADYQNDVQSMRNRVASKYYEAARTGEALITDTINLLGFGTDIDDDEFDGTQSLKTFEDLKPLTALEPTEVISGDPDEPATVFSSSYSEAAIIVQAALLSLIEYDSIEQSVELQKAVFENIDQMMETTDDDDFYNSLYDLKTAIVEHLDNQAKQLPRRAAYVPPVTYPALLIAYDLYDDITREQEVIDRNRIQHPAFVPGRVPIEVLIDA